MRVAFLKLKVSIAAAAPRLLYMYKAMNNETKDGACLPGIGIGIYLSLAAYQAYPPVFPRLGWLGVLRAVALCPFDSLSYS